MGTRRKTGINDYATTTKIVHNDWKTTENESLWTVLVVVHSRLWQSFLLVGVNEAEGVVFVGKLLRQPLQRNGQVPSSASVPQSTTPMG
jgi:hypothetical protein